MALCTKDLQRGDEEDEVDISVDNDEHDVDLEDFEEDELEDPDKESDDEEELLDER